MKMQLKAPDRDIGWRVKARAMQEWNPAIRAESADNAISILDVIGEDIFGEGVTARRVSAALRSIGDGDVVVNINSPGGDFFEGAAIHNLLAMHPGKVSVRVLGMAASAASVIAMAGDEIDFAPVSFMMIHNAWTIALGDRNDMAAVIANLEKFDGSMADLYAGVTGQERVKIVEMMDAETYLAAQDAVDMGFGTSVMSSAPEVGEPEEGKKARAQVEAAVMAVNPEMSRKERRALLSDAKLITQDADEAVKPRADVTEALKRLSQTISG